MPWTRAWPMADVAWARLRRHGLALTGAVVLALLVVAVAAGPALVPTTRSGST